MRKAPLPSAEELRLQTLKDYEVLDTLHDKYLDDITKAAAVICECKIGLVSLLDKNRQWFKSKYGISVNETARDISFCGHAILSDDLFIVEDASHDERFSDNPLLLNAPYARFYAGAPLIAPNGQRLGTLCVIDSEPKTLNDKQKSLLKMLSTQVISHFESGKILNKTLDYQRELQAYKEGLDAHALIARTDPDGTIIDVNDKFCHISKYSSEELVGKSHRILNSYHHSEDFFQELWRAIADGKIWRGDIRNKSKAGDLYWVDTTIIPLKNRHGEIVQFVAISYDITEKKEMEYLLNESQKYGNLGGWELNVDTLETRWTSETFRIYEISEDSPTNVKQGVDFYAEHEKERISRYVRDCIEKGIPFGSDFEFITAKGNKKWVHAKGVPEFDSRGRVFRVNGIFQDVTKIKELEIELRQLSEMKTHVLSLMAHDLVGHVRGLSMLSQVLKDNGSTMPDKERTDVVNLIYKSTSLMNELIQETLRWSKSHLFSIQPQQDWLAVNDVIKEVFDFIEPLAKVKGIELEKAAPVESYLCSDKNIIKTILRNLVENAVKNSTGQSKVLVHFGYASCGQTLIKVSDNGPPANRKKIDAILFPEIGSKLSKSHPQGLGLIFCRDYVHRLGGRIWFESGDENMQSVWQNTFNVSLPLALLPTLTLEPS